MSSKPPSVSFPVEKPVETRKERLRRYGKIALKWTKRLAVVGAVLFVVGLVAAWLVVRHYEAELPSVAELEKGYRPSQVTRVLARDGTLLAELFTERRTIVRIEELPLHLKKAVLAAEDATFYEHEGLNYVGIARAMLVNLRAGSSKQGGSTITQQVVKNILLASNEKTYKRKLREALLARRLEQELCPECGHDRAGKDKRKDKILELYLNHIYFGHGRYGIEEASRDAFGKSARELTIAEAALLAGVVKNPETYAPKRGLAKALERRKYVLEQMLAKGFINQAEFDAAIDEPVRLAPSQEAETELAPEAVGIAKKLLLELEPERGPRGGFTITTTIDPRLQAATRKALRENLAAYDKRHNLLGPWKAPSVASQKKGGARAAQEPPLFDGVPAFESHKVFTGVVVATDDVLGTIDVRIGQAIGSIKVADYKRPSEAKGREAAGAPERSEESRRYNPTDLKPSQLAEIGARLRVSLLAPVPPRVDTKEGQEAPRVVAKVPLRLELGPESAAVVLDVRTRHVLALAGNYEAIVGGLDRATQSRRQPGSTFKPVVYSYALHARRYTPASLVDVKPVEFPGHYKPSNYEGWKGEDPLRLREALANSVNVAAVHVIDDVGPANVVDWAKALGVQSTLKPDLSLALGSYEVHPLELAGAYATFAAGGMYEEPRVVSRIVGPDGKDVELTPPLPAHRVLEPAEAYVITSMLESVIDHGTAQKAKTLGRPIAGKTGTSNEAKDTWFAGYSTEIATVLWVGYDDNKPLGSGEAGGVTALPGWINVMKAAHENKPRAEFARPAGVVTMSIDPKSGKLAPEGFEGAIDEVFLQGTEPTETADLDGGTNDAANAAPATMEAGGDL